MIGTPLKFFGNHQNDRSFWWEKSVPLEPSNFGAFLYSPGSLSDWAANGPHYLCFEKKAHFLVVGYAIWLYNSMKY